MSVVRLHSKPHRKLAKALKPYGITFCVAPNGHYRLMRGGAIVYRMSATPKNLHQAIDNTLKDLRREGIVPKDFKL